MYFYKLQQADSTHQARSARLANIISQARVFRMINLEEDPKEESEEEASREDEEDVSEELGGGESWW
ncbi:hypothetical protein INT47_012292 [Mucor saturninus]|uniref:Uncharacterized protein n=1 Tax=Mucor saturninus TaxID=64648 RepID=A0A8H7R9L2_9FUNG|nr:hypothetical protein INT47_012292 [Mucor saturninus]